MTHPRSSARESFWDLAYRHGDHEEHWEPPTTPPELVAAVRSGLVGRGQTALDIGCGTGVEAVFLAAEGVFTIGVDSSRVALALARRRADDANVTVDWRHGDAARLPVRDNEVDLALDRGCFHVIARRRRRLYAREIARVLRPGGALLLRGAQADDEELGVLGFDRREIERLFGSRGFDCGVLSPLMIEARSGGLEGWKVVLTRRPTDR
jgi:ubiquinone/menaquinone biosynthesis C-methylase UbiE